MSWANDGIYIGAPGPENGIERIPVDGGERQLVVKLSRDEVPYGPYLLPDGHTLLFSIGRRTDPNSEGTIVVQSLRTGVRQSLVENASNPRYLAGHLLFARSGVVLAQRLAPDYRTVTGVPVPVIHGVRRANPGTTAAAHYAVSDSGLLAFIPGPEVSGFSSLQLAAFDPSGSAALLIPAPGAYNHPRVSPDG